MKNSQVLGIMMENLIRLLHKQVLCTNIMQICDIEAAINDCSLGNYDNGVALYCTIPFVDIHVYD